MTISGQNVDSWIDEMSRLASRFSAGFEAAYGYPPGEHYVSRSSNRSGRDLLATLLDNSSAGDLIEFYSHVAQISLPDVGPGFFVDAAEEVIDGLRGAQPTRVISTPEREIAVFGSDGGGALFAVDRQTGAVVRLEGGALIGADYEVERSGVQVIAPDFAGFMQFLQGELLQQIPSGG